MPSDLKPSSQWLCALLAVCLAFLLYLHFVLAFGVNVPFWDDWELLDKIRLVYSGQMGWWKLAFNKHNEHLIGTAFLLEAWQLLWTNFDYKLQLLTGILLQALTFVVLTALLWQSISQRHRALWLALSSLIWFSLCQYKNLLWAFQTAWFLVSLLLAISLVCLRRAHQVEYRRSCASGAWFALAVAAAILASFTSAQGVIVWPTAAVYLMGLRSYNSAACLSDSLARRWFVSALLAGSIVAYIWVRMGGVAAEGGGEFSLRALIYIFVGTHGDFWGNLGTYGLIALGLLMLTFVWLGLTQVIISKDRAGYALPVSLIAFGLSFAVIVATGRAKFGAGAASDSHYTAYSLLAYWGVLSILMRQDDTVPQWYPSRWMRFIYGAAIVLAVFTSNFDATLRGIEWRSDQGMAAAVLLNYREEPDFVLGRMLFGDPMTVRRNAEFLQVHRFGTFGDPNAIPVSTKSYTAMPRSLEAMVIRYPERQDAIRRAWQVYQIADDLRNAFNPLSDQFAHDLLNWCANATRPPSTHYLSRYLTPFASDYATIQKSELSKDNPGK